MANKTLFDPRKYGRVAAIKRVLGSVKHQIVVPTPPPMPRGVPAHPSSKPRF